jgi:hypothetical protein
MTITAAQNVGIGTDSPSFISGTGLVVSRSGGTATIQATRSDASTAGGVAIQSGNTQNNLASAGAKPLVITTDSTERMRIDSTGNVGIGTSSPNANTKLQINGGGIGSYWTNGSDGSQIYIGSTGFDNSSYYNSAPGIGSVLDSNTSTAGALALYVYTGSANSRTRALNLNANGNVALMGATVTTSGVGITFPATQSASTDANTLDDYEEGTWTPELSATFGSLTYSARTGYYVKIGRLVYASFFLGVSTVSSGSSNLAVGGLPFSSTSSTPIGQNMFAGFMGLNTAQPSYINWAFYNPTTAAFVYSNSGGIMTGGQVTNGCNFAGTITYLTTN